LLACTQNPTAGEEYRRGWHPEKFDHAPNAGSVLVVGAGPAGLECAMVLGKRGYTVHLRDCAPEVGGHWRDVARYPRCSEYGRLISYRQAQIAKLGKVDVHLGVPAMTADDILVYGADKVVIAVGAHWSTVGLGAEVHRPIDGVDASLPNVLTPEQVMAGKDIPGDDVVVLDGDGHFTGIAMAELLAGRGKRVTLVTNMNDVTEFCRFTMELPNNKRLLQEKRIKFVTNHWAHSFVSGTLSLFYLYRDSSGLYEIEPGRWGRRVSDALVQLPCDALVLVTSRVPNAELHAELKSRRSEWQPNDIQGIYRIGDCHAPRHALNAIFDGHRLAREFESPNPQYPLPFIRERQVWGHETFPKLGDPRPKVETD
jgi:dimethylamine/trimethylamine dehydrogenase